MAESSVVTEEASEVQMEFDMMFLFLMLMFLFFHNDQNFGRDEQMDIDPEEVGHNCQNLGTDEQMDIDPAEMSDEEMECD